MNHGGIFNEQMKLTHRVQGLVNSFGDDLSKTLEGALAEVASKDHHAIRQAEETPSMVRRRNYLAEATGGDPESFERYL